MYFFGGVAYYVGPNLELIKAAKYDKTQIRVDDKGRKWQFNEQTKRWRLADKQQPAGGASGGTVAGMQVVQDAPAAAKKQPKAAPPASNAAELKPKKGQSTKSKATPEATEQPAAVKPKKGRSPKPKAIPEASEQPPAVKPKKGRSPKAQKPPVEQPSITGKEVTDTQLKPKRTSKPKSAPHSATESPGGAIVPSPRGQLVPTASNGGAIVPSPKGALASIATPPSDTAVAQMTGAVQKTTAQLGTAKNSAYRLGQASRQLIRTTNDASKTLAQGVQSAKATIGQSLQGASRETQVKANAYLNNTTSAVREIKQATTATQQRIENNLNMVVQKIEGAEQAIVEIAANLQAASKRKRGSGFLRRQTTKSLRQVQQLALELDQTAKGAVKDAIASVGELGQAVGRSRAKAEASAQETLGLMGEDARRVAGAVKQSAGQMGTAFDAAQNQVMNAANDVKSEARNLYQSVRQVGRRAEAMVQKMWSGQPMQKALPSGAIAQLRPKRSVTERH